jgi:oligopeptide/dipeptide ABC transporter ATP-binding protein
LNDDFLVEIKDLTKCYSSKSGLLGSSRAKLVAVDKVSISFAKAKTTAIVGESGSGKTTLGECTLMLTKPDSGSVLYKGVDLVRLRGKELNSARKGMQIVFQDPFSSLSPRMNIRDILTEPVIGQEMYRNGLYEMISDVLSSVGLPLDSLNRYPHQFSGGQRQRIAIARALMSKPDFMVLDEPTSALDVSIQLQILNLFRDLQKKHGLTYLFITHNLAVAKYVAHMTAVMFSGRIVEFGPTKDIVTSPKHPYTAALLSSVPTLGRGRTLVLKEREEETTQVVSGCRYRLRCPFATQRCTEEPSLVQSDHERLVRCHYHDQIEL